MKIRVLILLLLLSVCHYGISQSFSLLYRGVKLVADTVLVRTGTPDSLELTTYLTIRNDATGEKQIQAKKAEISMVPGTACSLCWAGYCYPTDIFQTDYPLVLTPGATETSCFAHFITGGTIGTSIVRWTYFDKDDPEDSVSVVIHYILYPMGVGNPETKDRVVVSPNPADRAVFFRFTETLQATCTITVCTLSGRPVVHETVRGSDGSIKLNTSGLPAGIYLYSLHSGGKIFAAGKVVVLH